MPNEILMWLTLSYLRWDTEFISEMYLRFDKIMIWMSYRNENKTIKNNPNSFVVSSNNS